MREPQVLHYMQPSVSSVCQLLSQEHACNDPEETQPLLKPRLLPHHLCWLPDSHPKKHQHKIPNVDEFAMILPAAVCVTEEDIVVNGKRKKREDDGAIQRFWSLFRALRVLPCSICICQHKCSTSFPREYTTRSCATNNHYTSLWRAEHFLLCSTFYPSLLIFP